jgi:hypothetical protein
MKNISFGISQLKEETPKIVHWLSITGASLVTAMAALQLIYPQYITEHLIAETGKAVAAIRILGQFFGVAPDTEDNPTV